MDRTIGWGYYMQGSDQQIEVDDLGSWLSQTIHCAVHYPAWGKRMFECKCGITFPLFILHGKDKDKVIRHHGGME